MKETCIKCYKIIRLFYKSCLLCKIYFPFLLSFRPVFGEYPQCCARLPLLLLLDNVEISNVIWTFTPRQQRQIERHRVSELLNNWRCLSAIFWSGERAKINRSLSLSRAYDLWVIRDDFFGRLNVTNKNVYHKKLRSGIVFLIPHTGRLRINQRVSRLFAKCSLHFYFLSKEILG